MSKLSDLPNVGKVLEANLIRIGIDTPEKLQELGAEEVIQSLPTALEAFDMND